jgi:NADH:ubiquinone reductase (H+-translocating)
MVSLNDLPGVAQPAMQEGKYVAKVINARLAGEPAPPPFKYFDKGSMATIGYRAAVAEAFGMKFTGLIAFLMWGFIHVLYLIGWGNRLGTLYTWMRALVLSKNRGHRIITFEGAHDRLAEDGRTGSGRAAAALPPTSGEATDGVPPGSAAQQADRAG